MTEVLDTVELTPAMIRAGVLELREKPIGLPLEKIVVDVFCAMCAEIIPNLNNAPLSTTSDADNRVLP